MCVIFRTRYTFIFARMALRCFHVRGLWIYRVVWDETTQPHGNLSASTHYFIFSRVAYRTVLYVGEITKVALLSVTRVHYSFFSCDTYDTISVCLPTIPYYESGSAFELQEVFPPASERSRFGLAVKDSNQGDAEGPPHIL